MKIGNEYCFTQNYPLFEYVFCALDSHDFLTFPYTSHYIPTS